PPEWFGALQLCAYRLGAEGAPVRKSRTFYVRRPGSLRVRAGADRPEYRPGEHARVTLTVTDKDGRPAPGAVSVAAVDEAVFQVGTASGLEQAALLSEQLLQPVYELYPWSPDLKERIPDGPKRNLLEQALFARTVAGTGKNDRDAFLRRLLPFVE